jgi:hypothetical protein
MASKCTSKTAYVVQAGIPTTQSLRTAPLCTHWWQLEAGRKIASELDRQPAGRYMPPLAPNGGELGK